MTWFTQSEGKLKTMVKGAMRPKGRFAGVLDLFHECEIQVRRSRTSDLHVLSEAALVKSCEQIRYDYARLNLASYFTETIDLVTSPEHAAPDLYDLIRRALAHLDERPATKRALLHFEKELASALGVNHPAKAAVVSLLESGQRLPAGRAELLSGLP